MSEKNKQKPLDRSTRIAAQVAEMLLSSGFRLSANRAFDASESPETYRLWRNNTDTHLGLTATTLTTTHPKLNEIFWDRQRQIALDSLSGNKIGPFADYFFNARINGTRAEIEPSSDDVSHLPNGEYDVVQTNSMIVRESSGKYEDDPVSFLSTVSDILKSRRASGGNQFEGPENYATSLKLFADKVVVRGSDLDKNEIKQARGLVSQLIGGFDRISSTDSNKPNKPNVIEMTNILAAIKRLPREIFEPWQAPIILRHTLGAMDDFNDRSLKLLINVLGKIDVSECEEEAAMTLDLALRKGSSLERSGDMLATLQAVNNVGKSKAAERAFSTLLDVRSNLEIAVNNLDSMRSINALLKVIVENVTEDPNDTKRAKQIADYVARSAVGLLKDLKRTSSEEEEYQKYLTTVRDIIKSAKSI